MADTTFVNGTTVVDADWLNDVNDSVYDAIGNGTVAPTTPAQVRTNLNVPQRDGTDATGSWPVNVTGTAANVTSTVAIANGGTGQTTAGAAFDALKQSATDSYTGVVEFASAGEAPNRAQTGVVLSPATLRDALNAQNDPPIYAIRGWVRFNGTRNVTDSGASTNGQPVLLLAASSNISSVTKVSTGIFTVNFSTAMPNANYVAAPTTQGQSDGTTTGFTINHSVSTAQTTTAYTCVVKQATAMADSPQVSIMFVG